VRLCSLAYETKKCDRGNKHTHNFIAQIAQFPTSDSLHDDIQIVLTKRIESYVDEREYEEMKHHIITDPHART